MWYSENRPQTDTLGYANILNHPLLALIADLPRYIFILPFMILAFGEVDFRFEPD